MAGEASTARRERGGRARRQREAQRAHAVIAGIERKIPTYELIGEEGLARIEAAADTILQEVGIEFRGDAAALARGRRRRCRRTRPLSRRTLASGPQERADRLRPARAQPGALAQDR